MRVIGPPKRESRMFTLSRAQIKTEARTVELTFGEDEVLLPRSAWTAVYLPPDEEEPEGTAR